MHVIFCEVQVFMVKKFIPICATPLLKAPQLLIPPAPLLHAWYNHKRAIIQSARRFFKSEKLLLREVFYS